MRKLVVLASLALILGGVAYAAIPDAGGVIHGCYRTANPAKGALTVVDSEAGGVCPSGTAELNWNQTGPQGATGATGPQGSAAILPTGTFTGARMLVGSLVPQSLAPATNATFDCSIAGSELKAIAAQGWFSESGVNFPILVQLADSNAFKSSVTMDWSPYVGQLTPDSRVSWNVTCANVST